MVTVRDRVRAGLSSSREGKKRHCNSNLTLYKVAKYQVEQTLYGQNVFSASGIYF
jgi:hypothetical protein